MPSQTVDFLYAPAAALAGLYVSLVSNVDGVTKYSATTTSDTFGQWEINPKPPAGTYALYTGNAQGVLTTLVDPDFVVDPFQDDGTAVFPKQVTISAGGLVVTAGGINVTAGGITVAAGGVAVTGNSTLAGSLTVTGSPNTFRADGLGSDEQVRVSATAGFNRMIDFQTVGSPRWRLIGADNVAEGGANAGSNFVIEARDDTGVSLGNALSIVRSTRVVTIPAGLVITAGGLTVTAGGLIVSAGGVAATGNSSVTGTFAATGAITGASFDVPAAGQLQIGPAGGNASSIAFRSPAKALINGTALTALGAGAQTLSAANLLGGVIEHTVTGAVADTFDTGANLDAAVANVATGDTFMCILTVLGAFTVTLTAAAGITLRGTAAVVGTAAGKVCVLTMRRTGANAWTVYAATGA